MSSFSEYAKGSETVISSLPFTISTPGTYILSGNLNYTRSNAAITVEASNVVIDLKGFTLSATNTNSIGISVTDSEDFAIQNGEIAGFNMGLQLGGVLNAARNLKVLGCKYGITLNAGLLGFCEIQNCLIVGNGAPSGGAGAETWYSIVRSWTAVSALILKMAKTFSSPTLFSIARPDSR